MAVTPDCPLTPALLEALQTAVNIGDPSDKAIAEALFRSPLTIHARFKRIFEILKVHNRLRAIEIALQNGWITLPAASLGDMSDE